LRFHFVFFICGLTSSAADLRYWVEPCTRPETTCKADDPQLAQWALEAWQKASGGKLRLERVTERQRAHIRIHWASQNQGLYGEARPIEVDGVQGAEVYVLPDLRAMTPDIAQAARLDGLLRDAIVYLTCLHETGHALGLSHTAAFADIMYSFQYGGDIPEYFGRYRRLLSTRADIPKHSGISLADQARIVQVRQ
jgi:predicted Zn-dependent protease